MKLSPEQLLDWFLAARLNGPTPEFRTQWLETWKNPPEGVRRSQLVSGLKQAINDSLSDAHCWSTEEREKIEAALAAKGLPSVRKMAAGLNKTYQRILDRGRIRNEEEFYIVAEILSDLEFEISDADRKKLGEISHAFETGMK